MRASGKRFLIVIFIAMLGACGDSSSPPSKEEAKQAFIKQLAQVQKEAESGNAVAQFNIGLRYIRGEGVPKEPTKALEWFQKAASQGNADAQYYLGVLYRLGEVVPKDLTKALEWLQKAALQGNADAQFYLGGMYLTRKDIPKDVTKAIGWLLMAAVQGDARAQYILGLIYESGDGVPKNVTKAIEWWRKAAAQGHADAQFNLGLMYDKGVGVPKNSAKAVEWYQKAAAQGNVAAQVNLGVMYYRGEGVPKDVVIAAEWRQRAAAQGDVQAQAMLAAMYYRGEGVPTDQVLAYAWANLAAAQGAKYVGAFRDSIILSSLQRAEAERLSSNWKPGQILRREGTSDSGAGNAATGSSTLVKRNTGTAFNVSKEGHAVTNNHVVSGCKELRVQGRKEPVQLIARDQVSDLALLKLPDTRSVPAALMAPDPANLRQGQDVVVYGFPLNSILSSAGNLTPGVVSAITGLGNNTNQIQITAPIQPGSSGSPVLDKRGHVVGVVTMKISDSAVARHTGSLPQNVNFAVNGLTLKAFLDANRVPYKSGRSFLTWEKTLADLGDEARKWTTVVECWI